VLVFGIRARGFARPGNLNETGVSVRECPTTREEHAVETARKDFNCAMHDVCIVGAGPAGLSAALILGRCRRRVLVFDSGRPRNAVSRGLHGYLTRDGVPPDELRTLGRGELAPYHSVELRDEMVIAVVRRDKRFEVRGETGTVIEARILLLATGRDDLVPNKPGFAELYGRGVYHCPFCDGWEHRDEPLIAYGRNTAAFEVALELLTWSKHVTFCSDGPCELDAMQRRTLANNRIGLNEQRVSGLKSAASGRLDRIQFEDGQCLDCRALFFVSACPQKSTLPRNLGCELDETGAVRCNGNAATNVPGLFVAGNVRCGLHLAIMAAAEGAEAAVAINEALLAADLL
jgi:thioredoxin reductase